ncbi:eukaryotic translation initiation factor 4E [Aspergillus candidus]|uniref:Putative translation initiation factor eIF4E n=1 Tax=Aspergillus candidus TaxID=41067 RepID=A0A2I2F789_ASPCN|nr:putative translation initiation factor eIF4E [Aspergillus candidus]PLB36493.1 putative translation initiation factor eIF4E [Aspergillus candidus]
MAAPSLKLEPIDEDPTPKEGEPLSAETRKTLHQNIVSKLRPLPFQYHWAVWYDKHAENMATPSTYRNQLYLLHEDVSDIATFYRVYNNYPWHKIRMRDSVHIFRKGVRPIWEDPENAQGGCWMFRVPKGKAQAFFHEMAVLCLANEFQAVVEKEHDHVLGISMTVRFNSHLISIWHKLGSNDRSIKALECTAIDRLSPELRLPAAGPESSSYSYSYRRHDENPGYKEAMELAGEWSIDY